MFYWHLGILIPGLQFSVCDSRSYVGQRIRALTCSTSQFTRLFTEISSSSDNAIDTSISVSFTVCCSPQLPAAIAHHVVWKPLRLTAAVYSCEVLGCLWGLHWPALPCHSLLDCSLQQGTNSVRCMFLMVIFIQGLEWSHIFFCNAIGKGYILSFKISPEESKREVVYTIYTNGATRHGLRFVFTANKSGKVREGNIETVGDNKAIGTRNG